MLKARDLTLDSLNKQNTYTFVLGCREFSVLTLKNEYLILLSTLNLGERQSSEKTAVSKLYDDRIVPTSINVTKRPDNLHNYLL
jgi:hypothetical protein